MKLVFLLAILVASIARAEGGPGGANTVGDELYDDYENKGSVVIPSEEIEALASPFLEKLDGRLPYFAQILRQGIKGIVWYREPKPLDQAGACRNASPIKVNRVVRGCQNDLNVRFQKSWYDSKPKILGDTVIHELLVYQRIHYPGQRITEEDVLEVSRDIRKPNPITKTEMTAEELQVALNRANFGLHATKAELDKVDTLTAELCDNGRGSLSGVTPELEQMKYTSNDEITYFVRQKMNEAKPPCK